MQDLSSLAKGSIAAGSSMSAGGTLDNVTPWGKLPGTESEQTELSATGVDFPGHVSPDIDLDSGTSKNLRPRLSETSYTANSSPSWKTVK